jgi:hypothetical protein
LPNKLVQRLLWTIQVLLKLTQQIAHPLPGGDIRVQGSIVRFLKVPPRYSGQQVRFSPQRRDIRVPGLAVEWPF